ncbi:MAG: hypothetical protein PVF51_04890 [Nitrospirota bacterium]|jgi:hypothetical protein
MQALFAPLTALSIIAMLAIAPPATATSEGDAAPTTLKGEVIDTACYLGHGARGDKHRQCALNCLASGIPPSLLTDEGKLYLLLPPHGSHDAYDKVKGMAAQVVTVTGRLLSSGGLTALEVASVE